MRLGLGFGLGLSAIAIVAAHGAARAQSVNIENLQPSSPGDGELVAVSSTTQAAPGAIAFRLLVGLLDDPLVAVDEMEERVASVVSTRVAADLGVAIGLKGVELSLGAPLILFQDSETDGTGGVAGATSAGLGDARVEARGRVHGDPTRGVSVGIAAALTLPTTVNADYSGEETPTFSPYAVGQWRRDRALVALNLGARLREETMVGDLPIGSAVTASVGGAYQPAPRVPVTLLGEVAGELSGSRIEDAPLEARAGLRWAVNREMTAVAGYGHGLTYGYGAPEHRVFAGVTWRPRDPEPAQRLAGPVTPGGPPPNPDPDGDGILADTDKCPTDPEDFDGFSDDDGCPETDNDGDRLVDVSDKCPNHPEDVDGFHDEDGCPDPDNDLDGIADATDKCPDQAEIINGNQDDDGCPDEGKQLVIVGEQKIEIRDKLYFAHNRDVILPRSGPVLEQLAKTLVRSPWIKRLRIEGHTDATGGDAFNKELSQRRAESVRRAMAERGVDAARLEVVGYGEEQPIDSNATTDGRAKNRRVEFVIVEQSGARPAAQPTTGEGAGVEEEKKR
jgi:outer membrane protein OmpA-like peptidoglycan-associated protein